MKSINNKFWISKSIAPAFRLFDWLNFYEFKKVEVQCDNLEQGKIFLEAFLYFYDNNVQLNLTQSIEKREIYYLQQHEHRKSTGDLKYKPNKKGTTTYTIAEHYIDDKIAFDRMNKMMKEAGHIDLGDSRNFPNSDVAIQKIKHIIDCDLCVGHSTSWTSLARSFFDVPVIYLDGKYDSNGNRKKKN